jgi:O-antigen/teichoic acid export membrane protein
MSDPINGVPNRSAADPSPAPTGRTSAPASQSLSEAPPTRAVPDHGLSGVARGSALNLAGSAIASICSFGLVAIIARTLDRADAGVFFTTTSLFLVATAVGGLGTTVGLVYFLSRARATGQQATIFAYLRAALRPVLAVGGVMSVAMFVLAPQIGRATNPDHAQLAADYLHVISLFVVPAVAGTALLSATRGMGTMRPYVVIEQIVRQMLQVAAVAVVAILSSGLLAWAWAVPYVVAVSATVLWWHFAVRNAPDIIGDVRVDRGLRRRFWRFTAPRALGSVILLLIQRIDIVLVGALAGAVQAAVFTASTRFVVAGQMGGIAVALAVQSPLASAFARDDRRASARLFQTSGAWILGVTWPLYLTFCVSGDVLLRVFGSGYGSGSTVLLLVAVGMLVGTACGDVDSVLTMSGRTMASLGNATLALVVMLALDVWLIPDHGALGAAVGWAAAIATKNLVGLAQVWRSLRLHPFGVSLLLMAAINLACFGGTEWAVNQLPLPPVPAFVIGIAIASGTYVLGLWALRKPLRIDEFRFLRRRRELGRAAMES